MHSPTVSVPHAFSDPLAACMWIVRQASKGVYSSLLNGMDCHSCSRFWANAALVSLCLLAGIEGWYGCRHDLGGSWGLPHGRWWCHPPKGLLGNGSGIEVLVGNASW